jgi:hypothetical protein
VDEEWREVPGAPGYIVSSEGRAAKLLSDNPSTNGYIQHALHDGLGSRKREYRHTMVALAFFGPRPEGQYVLHKNDIKTDNGVENLRYGTPKENQADAFFNGVRSRKDHCKFGHALIPPNLTRELTCRTCNIARRRAQRRQVPFNRDVRDEVYAELMG